MDRRAQRPGRIACTGNGFPLNNNRNQNNRRRGRGNRNQGGGGNQSNRIDSRARGNAPQLLEKFRKLAEDAHRNGDRVQAEYYLQFADHYFRVIADNRARQDEQRGGERQDPRGPRRDGFGRDDQGGNEEFDGDFGDAFGDGGEERRRFEPRDTREPRRERATRDRPRDEGFEDTASEGDEGPAFEPADNPFTRDRGDAQAEAPRRRAARPRRDGNGAGSGEGNANGAPRREVREDAGFDPSVLPPSFTAPEPFAATDEAGDEADGEAAPRRRRKRNDGGTLSAVG